MKVLKVNLLETTRKEEECSKWGRHKDGLQETTGRTVWKDDGLAVVVRFEVVCQSSMER